MDQYDAVPPVDWDKIRKVDGGPKDTLIRKFETGATRDLDANKLDYEGFFSPLVMEAYARYMHGKRQMAGGSVRDSDNWQKGIPLNAYMKSAYRHFMDVWSHHRGLRSIALEPLETALCGLLFNVQGYLHEVLKARLEKQGDVK